MSRNTFVTLFCAATVFVLGAGIQAAPPTVANAPRTVPNETLAASAPAAARIPVLQTVVVRPSPEDLVAASPAVAAVDLSGSVMLGHAVEQAGEVIAERVGGGVRRVGLAIPYYAFGGRPARAVE